MRRILNIAFLFICAIAVIVMANIYDNGSSMFNCEQRCENLQEQMLENVELHKPLIDSLKQEMKLIIE